MGDNVANPSAASTAVNLADLAAYQARLQAAFVQALTQDDIQAIARKLIEQAREGDRTSARLVLKYSLGSVVTLGERNGASKPSARPNPDAAAFVANAAKLLKELDAEERRQAAAAAAHRPGGPPPGHPRR